MTTDNTSVDIQIDTKTGTLEIASNTPITLQSNVTTMQEDNSAPVPEQFPVAIETSTAVAAPAEQAPVHAPIEEAPVSLSTTLNDQPVATETAPPPAAEVIKEQAGKVPEERAPRQPRKPQEPRAPREPREVTVPVLPTPLGYKQDGVDHINLGGTGENSPLTMRLRLGHSSQFVVASDGPFLTLLGYWYYLLDEEHDDQFRASHEDQVRYLKTKKRLLPENNKFREKIARAYWDKINQIEALRNDLRASKLPFDAYFIFGKPNPKYPNAQHAVAERMLSWLVPFFEDARLALRENREPNFALVSAAAPSDQRPARRGDNDSRNQRRNESRSAAQAAATWEKAGINQVRDGLKKSALTQPRQGQQRKAGRGN